MWVIYPKETTDEELVLFSKSYLLVIFLNICMFWIFLFDSRMNMIILPLFTINAQTQKMLYSKVIFLLDIIY